MKIQLIYQVEVADDLDRSELLDEVAAVIAEHGKVIAQNEVVAEDRFIVNGTVKGKPDERWQATVYAQDEAEAEDKAKKAAPKGTEYTVAVVRSAPR